MVLGNAAGLPIGSESQNRQSSDRIRIMMRMIKMSSVQIYCRYEEEIVNCQEDSICELILTLGYTCVFAARIFNGLHL